MDQHQFLQLLESVLAPDTERVKAATASLRKNYYTSPASLTLLLQILTSHENSQLRQLAAVEARSLVPKHWAALPADQKPQIRTQLLQSTLHEDSSLVRHSSARVVSEIAKIDLDDGEWADLPTFLQQAATSQQAREREVGVYILFTLLESLGDAFVDKLSDLFVLFAKTLRDPESADVRVNTMLALSKIAMLIDTSEDKQSVQHFQELLPSMVAVLKEAVDAGDEDRTMQAFEVFQTLLGCDATLMAAHFKDLVQFMIDLAAQKDLVDESRSQAISFLMQCVKYRKLKVQAMRIGEQLTIKSLEIATELSDDVDEDDEVSPARSALGLLDIMASQLPPSQVVVPLLNALGPYLTSSDPDHRRAGLLSLGMCVEGAPDFFATQLHEILPMVLRLLQDPEIKVRHSALHALARLADDLAEDMGKEHAKLIPAVMFNLDAAVKAAQTDSSDKVLDIIKGSCNAIDSVIEGVEKEHVSTYLPEMVPRVAQLLSHPDYKVKASAAGALGSIAAAAEEAFVPFFDQTMNALSEYVMIKDDDEQLDLRGTVCDAMSNIASAVGPVKFQPYVSPLMQASEEALHLGHPRLRETSYMLWSTMSKVYEENFTPFLDGVVKGLFECLEQDETDLEVELGEEAQDLLGQEITVAGKKVKVAAAEGSSGKATLSRVGMEEEVEGDDEIDDVDEEEEDEDAWDDLTAVTAVALEKEIAVEVLGDVLTHTRGNFLPYLEKTIENVIGLVEHNYEGVRRAAISTVWRAYACLWGMQEGEGMQKWKPGLPLQVKPTDDLQKLGGLAMTATLALWQDEIDRATVTDINRNLAATLKLCGPAIINDPNVIQQISENLILTITKQHPCQQDLGDDEDMEGLDESSEYDWLLIDTALDVVIGLAAALGNTFGELWKLFETTIKKYASSPEALERSTAVGVIAECIQHMGEAVTPYTTHLLQLLLHRLSDEDLETKSNAAFAIGLLAEKSNNDQEILKNYNAILAKLEPLLHTQQARLLDNSAGCVSRMIMKHKEAVPVADVLPALVNLLPLKEDFEENEPIFRMIILFYQNGDAVIQGLTQQLLPVFAQVVSPPEEQLTEEIRSQLTELIKYLHKQQPALIDSNQVLAAVARS
ncbi:karyopherin Kap123 [Xylona heveae TC161]|uniref:Karyopherin Kap123 n=1 Tax=Xylona heveae (strain CBS 132557 / TC161) TaxID=1328760 RepID=A0A165FKB4_XYLHT|nr:karyopherin Kap123 [Xylona heveae TC161]KZF21078.1 karyopherin Kap123 [Xylona heveae TC161]